MDPYGVLVILLGILMLIVAYKGTQDNVVAAILGHPYGNSTL